MEDHALGLMLGCNMYLSGCRVDERPLTYEAARPQGCGLTSVLYKVHALKGSRFLVGQKERL